MQCNSLPVSHLPLQLYKHDDPECSELCECNLGEVLSCKVLECIAKDACNTGVAFYSHASPFYQAYRGQCLCYSGSFVCSKPPKGKKTMFLFFFTASRNSRTALGYRTLPPGTPRVPYGNPVFLFQMSNWLCHKACTCSSGIPRRTRPC